MSFFSTGNPLKQYTKMVNDKLREKKTVNIDMKPPTDDNDYKNYGTDTATQAIPFDTDQQLDKDVIKEVKENKEETLEETFNIWDHGGQLIYHGLHRMFMTLQALYIVVFDLSKPLDDLATFIDSTEETSRHHWTNLQFILSYILSVYSHSRIVEEDEENEVDKPTIFIVGTHKGKLGKTEKQQNDEAEKAFKIIQDVLKTKPYGNHVYHKYFAIENSQPTTDKSFSDLKQVIDELMKALEKPFPLKWMRFRCDLHDLRGKKQPSFSLCPLEEIKILKSKNGIVEKEKYKSVLLNFLYDLGEIVYMPDNKLLRDKVVLDPLRLVEIVTKFVTVVPPKYPSAKFRRSFDKLDKGILEEDLLRKLWKDSKVDDGKNFEFLVALMIQLGFICERKTTNSQDVASTSTKSVGKRSFFVPLRLAIKTSQVRQVPDGSRSISRPIYYDFEGYLPDVLFPYLIIEFLNKFQKEGVDPILACSYAELYLNEYHHVILSLDKFITKNDERKFLLKMAIKRTDSFDETSKEEPSAEACKLVLSTVEKSFEQSKDGGRSGIPFKRCIPCQCSDQLDKKHFQILKDFQCRKLTCTETGKAITMDVTCYKRLFGGRTDFQSFKVGLSRCFDDIMMEIYHWLKFLLFGHLGFITYQDFNYLLIALKDKGFISPTNVYLLLEIAQLSEIKAAEVLVILYMKDNVQDRPDTSLSSYRKQLFKALRLREEDQNTLRDVIDLYELTSDDFTNIWDAVLYLEIKKELADDSVKIQKFANCLSTRARNTLLGNSEKDKNETASSSQQLLPTEDLHQPKNLSLKERIQTFFKDDSVNKVKWQIHKLKRIHLLLLLMVQRLRKHTLRHWLRDLSKSTLERLK
ncbi:uncharacterized protein [Antedon mediterranea]|uniref:uncharacterized protein n=1 Tax=Antedon mediterranea TaxID=105859 RepID=UPI003AF45B94